MDEGLLEDDDNNNDEEELEEDEGEVEELLMGGERAQTEYALCQSSSDYYEYRRKQKARSLRREKLEKRHCDKSSSAAGSVTGRREKSMPKHDDKGCLVSLKCLFILINII
jgi:hypothetical protein